MVLEAKGSELFVEAMDKLMNNEVTGKTILVVTGKEMVYEVLCNEWVNLEVVTIEHDGSKIFKEGDMVYYDVVDQLSRMPEISLSCTEYRRWVGYLASQA